MPDGLALNHFFMQTTTFTDERRTDGSINEMTNQEPYSKSHFRSACTTVHCKVHSSADDEQEII